MGRKRTSNKRDLKLWVDRDIIKKLNEHKVNKSELFEKSAKIRLKEIEEKEEQKD